MVVSLDSKVLVPLILQELHELPENPLLISEFPTFEPAGFDPSAEELTWFTDGSVVLQESFWLTAAAFAIFDSAERLVASAPVRHIALAAYTAELFALAVAIIMAPARVRIFTDCKTIVDLFSSMLQSGNISPQWSHAAIWRKILQVWQTKASRCDQPIQVLWMPAHTCDHRTLENIGVDENFSNGLSGWHIRANRRADEEAKRLARDNAALHVGMWPVVSQAAWNCQEALVRLNRLIGSDGVIKQVCQTKEDAIQQETCDECKSRFPAWDWTPDCSRFTWRAQSPCPGVEHVRSLCAPDDADQFLTFLSTLKWRVEA